MAKFLVTYHGNGSPAPDEMPAAQAAFGKWLQKAGQAVVNPGAPLAFAGQVATGSPVPRSEIGGYSILEAASPEAAIALLRDHPFVQRGGTLQVSRQIELG
jgi:hypothetical protein